MNTASKLILIIAGLVLAFLLLAGGAVWLWFSSNREALRQEAEHADAEGRRYAREHAQAECLTRAVERGAHCTGMACRIGNSLFASACLDLAKPSPGLCQGVPAPDEVLALSRWSLERCAAIGRSSDCPAEIFSQLAKHCAERRPVLP